MDATDKLGSSKNTETEVLEGFCLYGTKQNHSNFCHLQDRINSLYCCRSALISVFYRRDKNGLKRNVINSLTIETKS